VERGFRCTDSLPASQPSLPIPVVYRDFIRFDLAPHGHPDFDNLNGGESGIVKPLLGTDGGKPVYASAGTTATTHGAAYFDQWYRDAPEVNRTVVDHLTVRLTDAGSYLFDSASFFPLDGRGWQGDGGIEPSRNDGAGRPHNFSFTSELRYWFSFAGGELLEFRGDDDVWVFVNRHLAVDLGGVHSALPGSVTLDPGRAQAFGLADGGVYEVVVFQAERHVTASNYKLTLRGFNAPKSVCDWTCGDGIATRFEVCDDGVNDGGPGGCLPGCLGRGPYCGDAQVDTALGEVCDDGVNLGAYGACAPGCRSIRRCGDGLLQVEAGEECDDGNTTPGDGCDATCHVEIN
jgi:fibro-slime domain-containing protein